MRYWVTTAAGREGPARHTAQWAATITRGMYRVEVFVPPADAVYRLIQGARRHGHAHQGESPGKSAIIRFE